MSANPTDSRLIGTLFSLANAQLRSQNIRSIGLSHRLWIMIIIDVVMASTVAIAGGFYYLWIGALVLLCISVGLAVGALRLAEVTQNGPPIAAMLKSHQNQDGRLTENGLLDALSRNVQSNEPVLARGAWLFDKALLLFVGAVVIDFAGRLM